MKNTSRKHYIYKVTNLETGQYYIGSQCSGKTVGVNYFTNSTDKNFMDDFKNYGEEKYKIEIIKEFEEFEELEDPKKCVRVENYMIRDHMLLKDGLCLNRSYHCNGEKVFSTVGIHHTPWNKGRKGISRSEETRKKLSIAPKRRIKISIEGTVFNSLTEASEYYNVSVKTIERWTQKKQHNAFHIEK